MSFGKGVLPESSTLGSINPHTLSLDLECASRPGLEAALRGEGISKPVEVLSHELCHWADIVGTVWGQSYLDSVFTALDLALTTSYADIVDTYQTMIALFDTDRAIMFPTYYKTINPAALPTTARYPWAIDASCGVWIDAMGRPDESRPIFFVRFDESLGGPRVARQPITVGTLLEMRAFACENATFSSWSKNLSGEEQVVSNTFFRRQRLQMFYDPQFTTYTAAAHLLGKCAGLQDFVAVCILGSEIAHLCLNAVPQAFAQLKPPTEFRTHFTPPRLGGFRRSSDRGYVFACLVQHVQERRRQSLGTTLDEVVRSCGLTSTASIYCKATQWFERRLTQPSVLKDAALRRLRVALVEIGVTVFNEMRARGGSPVSIAEFMDRNLPSPSMMTNDGEQFNITTTGLTTENSDFLNSANARLSAATRMALRAGRGLEFGFDDYVY